MSQSVVNEILDLSLIDEQFRRNLETDPEGVLATYDLSETEREAFIKRDQQAASDMMPGRAVPAVFIVVTMLNTHTNNNITAARVYLDEGKKEELRDRAGEIAAMEGDRVPAIKELLAQMR